MISISKNVYVNKLDDIIRKLHSPFIGNIWHDGLADVQLIIKFNEGVSF